VHARFCGAPNRLKSIRYRNIILQKIVGNALLRFPSAGDFQVLAEYTTAAAVETRTAKSASLFARASGRVSS
jgi:hypothetical protein